METTKEKAKVINYHKRPEWSYSSMKKIIDSGIDYAVAAKQGMLGEPSSSYIDLGQLAHMLVLGGEDTFAVCDKFTDFRTKEAREWRDAQIAAGKNIITQDQFDAVTHIVENIEKHPYSEEYLLGKDVKHEQEMFAKTAEGVDLRGKADATKLIDSRAAIITDIKTTAQFDKFKKSASWNHYDLQAAVYTLIAASHLKVDPNLVNYYFCVAETIAPYRVQYFHASIEFVEAGERKLRRCIDSIVEFGDKQPSFLISEIGELGDWSF
ncbi:PD-(D/E)XK nuclease-like domain-containing protein [Patescibacteria group bacterium]|nr:PD-(D/E)XK nuclease-like domain-containing protein [Patescibacteria group bacterium]